MQRWLLCACLLALAFSSAGQGQVSDFISVVKRNGRTVKSFFPGVPISLVTFDQRTGNGDVTAIRNDSVFVKEWDIRTFANNLGLPMQDTVGAYIKGFHYKEIDQVVVSTRMKFQQIALGRILIIGGVGYALLNVLNGAFLHESITTKKNLTSLGIAGGAVAAGVLANYISRHRNK